MKMYDRRLAPSAAGALHEDGAAVPGPSAVGAVKDELDPLEVDVRAAQHPVGLAFLAAVINHDADDFPRGELAHHLAVDPVNGG